LNYEDIRPYNDNEYKAAIEELFDIQPLMETIYRNFPELSENEVKDLLLSFNGLQEFQSNIVCRVIQNGIDSTMKAFSFDGLIQLGKNSSHIFITNHRDIVVDSALINYCLDITGNDTCEIAIGSNLLAQPWVKSLVRLNKSFIVKRNIPKQEILAASKTLSSYINYTINEKKQSIWIAQREGRAKDGFDKTNPGVLKMFALNADGNLLDYLINLNITPVSLSYEYDPCDDLKIQELLDKEDGKEYVKSENEDNEHMMLGIQGSKGNVHLQFGTPINEEIKKFSDIKNRNELLKKIAKVIDREIYKNYKLWNSNYVAYDLLNSSNKYANKYSENGKEMFIGYMNKKLKNFSGNERAKNIFLQMYANPVINAESVTG
jgi:1-acyl-sn-glycerol-3-phosphate acyltransferase